ncbi:uncharacterized protein [Euwallacea similis]|uniref:uncharacterized protein n=1 Tax=Euwallacea similis TaxID=1736056 RepID=UPI00344D8ADE
MSVKEKVEASLARVADIQAIVNYELSFDETVLRGDGFLSEFYTGSVKNKDTGEVIETYIKFPPHQDMSIRSMVYANEFLYYDTIYPQLQEFQKEKGIKEPFNKIPRFFCGNIEPGNEYIVLENLKLQDYNMWDKTKFLDEEHLNALFKVYGKYHALTFAFKHQNREKYEEMTREIQDVFDKLYNGGLMTKMLLNLLKIAQSAVKEIDEKKADRLQPWIDDFMDRFITKGMFYKGDYSTLTHGDCWSNNILFKYDKSETLEDLRLIDHQLVRDSTPVHDLSYFFYAGAAKKDLDKLDQYLETYYDSFCSFARELDSDPEKLLPLKALKSDWEEYSLLGVKMGLIAWQIKLISKENIVKEIGKVATSNLRKCFEDASQTEVYKANSRDILLHALEYGSVHETMSAELTSEQRSLVEKAALASNFKDFEIIANVGSLKGDNYLGVLHTISVKPKNGSTLYLILKSAHSNDIVREKGRASYAFQRESFIYDTIIPRLRKLQEEKGISSPFTGSAEYYGSNLEEKKESILMKNLKEYGYKMWDRKKPMDDLHIIMAFKEYARLHAASFALKHLHPEEFQELTKDIHLNVFEGSPNRTNDFFDNYFRSGLIAVNGSKKAEASLMRMQSRIKDLFKDNVTQGTERFVVIHGDCWCNNMLFKYQEDNKTPSKVCFIDWQLSKLASPVIDLTYFFCVCCSRKTYPNLTKYLKIYHDTLSHNLKEFGCNSEELFSFQALLEEWNGKCWYGVFMSLMIIKLMLLDSEEAPALEQEGQSLLDTLSCFSTKQAGEYSEKLCDLVEFMVDSGYL